MNSHFVAVVGDWLAAIANQVPENQPFSLEQVGTDFFLFPHVKEAQAGCPLTATSPKPAWVGVTATTAKEAYVAVFRKQFKRCLQAIQLEDECAENNAKTLILLTCLLFVLFSLSGFRPNTPRNSRLPDSQQDRVGSGLHGVVTVEKKQLTC